MFGTGLEYAWCILNLVSRGGNRYLLATKTLVFNPGFVWCRWLGSLTWWSPRTCLKIWRIRWFLGFAIGVVTWWPLVQCFNSDYRRADTIFEQMPKCIHPSDLWIRTLKKTGFGPLSWVVFSENLCRSSLLFFVCGKLASDRSNLDKFGILCALDALAFRKKTLPKTPPHSSSFFNCILWNDGSLHWSFLRVSVQSGFSSHAKRRSTWNCSFPLHVDIPNHPQPSPTIPNHPKIPNSQKKRHFLQAIGFIQGLGATAAQSGHCRSGGRAFQVQRAGPRTAPRPAARAWASGQPAPPLDLHGAGEGVAGHTQVAVPGTWWKLHGLGNSWDGRNWAEGVSIVNSICSFRQPKLQRFPKISTTETTWGPGNVARHGAAVAERAAPRRAQRQFHGPLRWCGDSHDPRGPARPRWRGSFADGKWIEQRLTAVDLEWSPGGIS